MLHMMTMTTKCNEDHKLSVRELHASHSHCNAVANNCQLACSSAGGSCQLSQCHNMPAYSVADDEGDYDVVHH